MAPKRKSRPSTRATSPAYTAPSTAAPSPVPQSSPPHSPTTSTDPLSPSQWTTAQETALFKALIKYKPTGLHKHFSMLSVRSYLLSHGYIHPSAQHTRIPGLWKKLHSLYDLEALDEREDAVDERLHPEYSETSDVEEKGEEEDEDEQDVDEEVDFRGHAGFELDDGFEAVKWRRRFVDEEEGDGKGKGKTRKRRRSSSPLMPELMDREPPVRFVPSFSVEVDEVGMKSSKGKVGRRGRRRESLKRSRVPDSAAESEEAEGDDDEEEEKEDEEEDEENEDDGDEEEEEEEEEDGEEDANEDEDEDKDESEEESSEEQEEETRTPAPRGRGGRGRGGARGRARGRRRR